MSVGSVSRLGVGGALSTADLDALAADNDMSWAASPSAFETLLSAAKAGISPADHSLLLARNDFLNGNNLAPVSANSSESISQSATVLPGSIQDDIGVGAWTQKSSIDAVAPLNVADGTTAEIADASSQSVSFAGPTGTLKLDDAVAFTGQVSGLSGSDALDLADIHYGPDTTATYLGNTSGGVLTVSDGSHTANIDLVGNYLSSSWDLSSDGNGGTIVVDPVSPNNWQTLKVGAGGYLTGIDIAPDGTMVVRTDTYGAYLWNGTAWQQLVTSTSMPAAAFSFAGQGVYEIQIAPSNSDIMYMMDGGYIFKSANKGTTWTETSFAPVTEILIDAYRMDGQKMAVDPNNPNVVYAGTQQNGLFVTTDGGTTWQSVTAVPVSLTDGNGVYPGITGIQFDPALGVTGGKTNTIFASSYGHGVYESTNGGASWSAIGGPSNVSYAAVSSTGVYYAVGDNNTSLWSYANGTWSHLISGFTLAEIQSVAVDPFNPNEIVIQTPGGYLDISYDAGATWSGVDYYSNSLSATDIPWLANSGYMTIGGTVFDPLVPNKLWASDGVGVWNTTNLPTANLQWYTPVVWNSQSIGIEQLVANEILVPPGGDPVVASWDRAFFYISNANAYPSTYGPANGAFAAGWSIDYASSNPSFLVGIAEWWGTELSGYSTNGGQSWTTFPSFIPGASTSFMGGTIAASTPENIIWAPADGQQPYYTLNGGESWNPITLPGVSSWSNFDWAYYLDTRTVTADRVLPNTFYLYYAGEGVYESTNGGVSWTQVFSGQITTWSNFNAELQSVPGEAGNLFFTAGPQSGGTQTLFWQSTNQGATWTAVPNVQQVNCFGFGAPAPGQSYPSIYIVGWVNNVLGIWQSNDDAHSWVQIGTNPQNSLDGIKTISGDPNLYGQVYVGFQGSGYAYLPAASLTALNSGSTTDGAGNVSSAVTNPVGALQIDAIASTLTSLVESSSSGDLNAGKMVTLTLNLSEAVTVAGGTPTLALNDGGVAIYTGGSGTGALTFSYTVGAGQNTSALTATAVNLNSATIKDGAGNAANLSLTGLTQAGPQIDTTAATVSSLVESPSSGELNAGKTITLTLSLSETVTVAGGIPTLTLNDGGTATYTGGSGSSALSFSYTVASGQSTSGLAVAAVNLNAATITDAAGNAANLSLTELTQSGPQIDTVAPPAPEIVNDAVNGNQVILTGAAEALGSTVTSPAGAWSYTTGPLTNGAHTFMARATDAAGNTSPDSNLIDPFIGQIAAPTILSSSVGNGATSHTDKLILTGAVEPDNTVAVPHSAIELGTTTSNSLVLTGKAEPDSTVTVFDRSVELGTTTANSTGSWNYKTGVLSDGNHRFTATDTIAGDTSASSTAFKVRVDADLKTSDGDHTKISGGLHAHAKLIDAATLGDIFGKSSKADHKLDEPSNLGNDHHASTTASDSVSDPNQSSPILESPDPHSGADHHSVNTSAASIVSAQSLGHGLTNGDTHVAIEANDASTSVPWHINISKLREMIGSLQGVHKNVLSSDAQLSHASSSDGFINTSADAFLFKAGLGDEILRHPNSAADSAEIAQQLDALYAELHAELHTVNAESTPAPGNDATTMSHELVQHLHLDGLHLG